MTVTDDRFLDSSFDDMMLDYYADYYRQLKASGKTEMFEDDNFDVDVKQILDDLEAQDDGSSWETVEDWDVSKSPDGLLPDD